MPSRQGSGGVIQAPRSGCCVRAAGRARPGARRRTRQAPPTSAQPVTVRLRGSRPACITLSDPTARSSPFHAANAATTASASPNAEPAARRCVNRGRGRYARAREGRGRHCSVESEPAIPGSLKPLSRYQLMPRSYRPSRGIALCEPCACWPKRVSWRRRCSRPQSGLAGNPTGRADARSMPSRDTSAHTDVTQLSAVWPQAPIALPRWPKSRGTCRRMPGCVLQAAESGP